MPTLLVTDRHSNVAGCGEAHGLGACFVCSQLRHRRKGGPSGKGQLWQFHTKAALLSNSVQSVSVKFALFHRHISWNSKQARPETGLLSRVIPLLTGPNQGLVLLPLKRSDASNCPTILLWCAGVHPQSHMRIGLGEVTGLWEESDLGCFWRTTPSVTKDLSCSWCLLLLRGWSLIAQEM